MPYPPPVNSAQLCREQCRPLVRARIQGLTAAQAAKITTSSRLAPELMPCEDMWQTADGDGQAGLCRRVGPRRARRRFPVGAFSCPAVSTQAVCSHPSPASSYVAQSRLSGGPRRLMLCRSKTGAKILGSGGPLRESGPNSS
jgi:hypothetical protein